MALAAIVGLGYVPARSPPAGPVGGSAVGAPASLPYAMPAATFASVTAPLARSIVPTVPSAIFALVTAPSASWVVPTAAPASPGFGYVPLRLPPAAPFGGNPVGTPVSLLYEMPDATFASVTAPVPISVAPTHPTQLTSCALAATFAYNAYGVAARGCLG